MNTFEIYNFSKTNVSWRIITTKMIKLIYVYFNNGVLKFNFEWQVYFLLCMATLTTYRKIKKVNTRIKVDSTIGKMNSTYMLNA